MIEVSLALAVLVKEADFDSVPMSCDIRGWLSLLAFLPDMQVAALSGFSGWSSSRAFRRRYHSLVDAVELNAVVVSWRMGGPSGSSVCLHPFASFSSSSPLPGVYRFCVS